jgi:non-homologous end joining protein Ku
LAVLMAKAWGEEAFHQLLVDTLLAHAPMALVGLLLMLVGSRLDFPAQGRSPLRWTVLVVGVLMSLSLFVAIPVQVGGNKLIQLEADRSVDQKRSEFEQAQQESQDPKLMEMLQAQLEQAGQVSAEAKPEDKKAQVQALIDQRLDQLKQQMIQAERTRDLTLGQRRWSGTAVALLLALATLAVALAAVL